MKLIIDVQKDPWNVEFNGVSIELENVPENNQDTVGRLEKELQLVRGSLDSALAETNRVKAINYTGQLERDARNYAGLEQFLKDLYTGTQVGPSNWVNTIKMVRQLQPDILVNDRTGDGGDFSTPEQEIGRFNMDRPWESCMTISAHGQWAWGGPADGVKPLADCVLMVVRAAGGNGNVLLNVGPTPEGVIEPCQTERLKEIGAWLAKYGESIYGTRGGPYKPGKCVVSTRKGNTVYVHVSAWPQETLLLPPLPAKIVNSRLLTGGTATVKQGDGGLEIAVPKRNRQEIDTIVAVELDRPAMEIRPIAAHSFGKSLTAGQEAKASNCLVKKLRRP